MGWKKGRKHTPETLEKMRQSKMGEKNPRWGGSDVAPLVGRKRAGRRFPVLGKCEYEGGCEKPARERHHKDGNTSNNDRSNLQFLCAWHHHLIDGRLEALAEQAKNRDRDGEYRNTEKQQVAHKRRGESGKRDSKGRFIKEE